MLVASLHYRMFNMWQEILINKNTVLEVLVLCLTENSY